MLRLFDIYVDMHERDDELQYAGGICARNQTAGPATDGVVKCSQPIKGQFVRIDNLVHMSSERYLPDYEKCLELCEVKIFVKG